MRGQPHFSILICGDSAILKEELERQISGWDDARRLVFWGDEEPREDFWSALQQVGLFSERRIVVIRQGELWHASVWKGISEALSRPHDGIWPIFCLEGPWEKGKPKIPTHIQKSGAYVQAERNQWIWSCPGLGQNKSAYARNLAKKLGLKLPPDELSAFCAALPNDAAALSNELAKLHLVCDGGAVTRELLPPTSDSLESDAFTLIRRLTEGDLPTAWRELARDSDGSLLFFVIALLAREFRTLWQLTRGESPRLYPSDAQRMRSMARKLSFSGIAAGFSALADADWHVKSGQMTPQQSLEHLCVAIVGLISPSPLP